MSGPLCPRCRCRCGFTWSLNDPELLRTKAYIDGQWVDADDGTTFKVYNPATHEVIAEVANCGTDETRRAIEAARVAQKDWAAKSAVERSAILKKWKERYDAKSAPKKK